jgi:hypothetical protein
MGNAELEALQADYEKPAQVYVDVAMKALSATCP